MTTDAEDVWPCVGVCMPDADEEYCIGCGRPWNEPRPTQKPDPETESPKPDDPSAA